MSKNNSLRECLSTLVQWYRQYGESLAWRKSPGERQDPYLVWVSEIMLQQTTVAVVTPYYEKFIQRFPTLKHLANSSLDEVLSLWSGLGYYKRAHRMHECALKLDRCYKGVWPGSVCELIKLPGIGAYTAGAIQAIALQKPAVVVDTNVRRVLGRYLGIQESQREKELNHLLQDIKWDDYAPGDFYQGLMDTGRLFCRVRSPQCEQCPLVHGCKSKGEEKVIVKKKKAKPIKHACFFVAQQGERYFLRSGVPEGKMLEGLWIFPSTQWLPKKDFDSLRKEWVQEVQEQTKQEVFRHVFSHFTLYAYIVFGDHALYTTQQEGVWVKKGATSYPLSSLASHLFCVLDA